MKKAVIILMSMVLYVITFGQEYAVLSYGSTKSNTINPGDTVAVPVKCEYITSPILGFGLELDFDEQVLEWQGATGGFFSGIQNINPALELTQLTTIFGYFDGQIAINYFDPSFLGSSVNSGEILFEFVFTYLGGETILHFDEGSNLYPIELDLIDGCVCTTANYPVLFHVTSGDYGLEDAEVTIDNTIKTTNEFGVGVFSLSNGNYFYEVSKDGYQTQTDSITVNDMSQTIDIAMNVAFNYPVTFNCDVSCENQFNGWNMIIGGDTLMPGETIYLPEGDYSYSLGWLDCWPSQGGINLNSPVVVDCSFIGDSEPHTTFHIFSGSTGNIEGAGVMVDSYSLFTNASGEAGFCLPGGLHQFSISKEGYDTISDNFYYMNYCQDTLIEIMMNPVQINAYQTERFRIYPNPSNGIFYFEPVKKTSSETCFTVSDISGRIVYSSILRNGSFKTINLTGRKAGIYFIKISSGSALTNRKLILQP